MKNRRKSGMYTIVHEHFEERFHLRLAKDGRSFLQGEKQTHASALPGCTTPRRPAIIGNLLHQRKAQK